MIDDVWVRNVCLLGQGAACCRCLAMTGDGFVCAKLHEPAALLVNKRIAMGEQKAAGDNWCRKGMASRLDALTLKRLHQRSPVRSLEVGA